MAGPAKALTTRNVIDRYEVLYRTTDYGRAVSVGDRLIVRRLAWAKTTFGVSTVLEVGCGRGGLVRDLNEKKGLRATGTEIVPYLLAHDLKGDPVYPYGVEDLSNFGDGSYDVVIFNSVLDHLATPALADKAIVEAVRIAGVGVLAVVCAPSPERTINIPWSRWEKVFQGQFRGGTVDLSREVDGTCLVAGWKRGARGRVPEKDPPRGGEGSSAGAGDGGEGPVVAESVGGTAPDAPGAEGEA